MRMSANQGTETEEAYREVTATVGGRLSYLAKIAKHPNMLSQAEQMLRVEKAWLLSQIGLIPDHDDDVMDEINHNVTPDSLLLLRAAREVVEEEGFDEMLDDVRDRVDEIESLHRTRELTFKDVKAGDRVWLTVDKGGARLVENDS
ncbi:hypothetical protein PHLCEN_2v10412 [Hermanssonia centrifuga]|uniref:AAA protein C-terminal winged helix domain-containing protein n=1 Tax=Hermanssonia centrifuga TaxID=98765 RepID=A0A2R6NN09_9APHY|nr:hypothetical protein PHLCEN_2v10412 [Hermanssonia centrifuga]